MSQEREESTSSKPPHSHSDGQESDGAGEVQEAIRKLSEQKPDVISQMIAMGGSITNPLHHKMTEGHISQILDLAVHHDEREYDLAKGQQGINASNRWFRLVVFLAVLVFVAALIAIFRGDKDVLVPLITGILAFAGGFGSGWGYGRNSGS